MLKIDKIKQMMTLLQKYNLGITQLDYFVDQVSLIQFIIKKNFVIYFCLDLILLNVIIYS